MKNKRQSIILAILFILCFSIISVSIAYRNYINKIDDSKTEVSQNDNLYVVVTNSTNDISLYQTTNASYGDFVSLSAPIIEGYSFLYWVDKTKGDKIIHYATNLSFYVTKNNMHFEAVYSEEGNYTVRFVDYNGYIIPGGEIIANGSLWNIVPPSRNSLIIRPGNEFKYWSLDGFTEAILENITIDGDLTFYAVYDYIEDLNSYDVVVSNGTSLYDISFGEIVSIVAEDIEGSYFSHWFDNTYNQIISYSKQLSFSIYRDMNLSAKYHSSQATPMPLVILDEYYFENSYQDNYQVTVIGKYELPQDYLKIETGVLLYRGRTIEHLTFNTIGVIKVGSTKQNQNGEFSITDINIPTNLPLYARSYLSYKHNNDIVTVYSENMVAINSYADDLLLSEYIEGTSYNKSIEIFNGTGLIVDLSIYSLRLYTNGTSTQYNLALSGELSHNDVYVISHSSASSMILEQSNLYGVTGVNTVINFNGNDPIALLKNGVIIDIIGNPFQTTTAYTAGSSNSGIGIDTTALENNTITRQPWIYKGNTSFDGSEWIVWSVDNFNYIGSHQSWISTQSKVTEIEDNLAPTIYPNAQLKTSLKVGDLWVDYGCTAIDNVDGVVPCTTHEVTVNPNVVGTYRVTYRAVDSSGNIGTLNVDIIVYSDETIMLSAYYTSVTDLTGQALLEQLRIIINTGVTLPRYEDAKTMLQVTDRDPNNASNIILVYRGTSVLSTWDGGVTWNREHVWPQSLLGVSASETARNEASDLHNLKPANPSENSSRGNKYFDNIASTVAYTPRDEVKGDIARILLYMVVKYPQYTLVNDIPVVYQMAMLDTLLAWHVFDPVDDFERNRNEVIYSYQYNRNPFIDYPHFVNEIWGNA